MIQTIPAYITIKRFDLYGYKAVPTGKKNPETKQAEFVIIEPNPHRLGIVWLTKNEIC
jgi:hypothetical protein